MVVPVIPSSRLRIWGFGLPQRSSEYNGQDLSVYVNPFVCSKTVGKPRFTKGAKAERWIRPVVVVILVGRIATTTFPSVESKYSQRVLGDTTSPIYTGHSGHGLVDSLPLRDHQRSIFSTRRPQDFFLYKIEHVVIYNGDSSAQWTC